jgi:hypothetical protein
LDEVHVTPFEPLRELRQRLDELAAIDWRHPAWWTFAGGAAVLTALARGPGSEADQHRYLGANGGPASDNYMGREAAPAASLAHAVAVAVMRARAALATVDELDGSLPEQPLAVTLGWRRGWLERQPLPRAAHRVAFVTPRGNYLARLDPGADAAVATALGLALAGRAEAARDRLEPIDPQHEVPVPAAVAVAIGAVDLPFAQHVHRSAWSRGGGPWLGVGDAAPLAVVTTCHVVVDGYAHALISDRILRAGEPPRALIAAARLGLGEVHPRPVERLAPPAGAVALSFAGRELEDAGDIARQAHAFGRALERVFCAELSPAARRAARFSPTFQIPVAPGRPGDPDRRKHRVVHALCAVPMADGRCEDLEVFCPRLRALLRRVADGEGLLARLSLGAARAPMPDAARRRLLGSRRRSHRLVPPFEVLAGRGRLSSMKFPAAERPAGRLYAVSSPTLLVTPDDPLGAIVLSLVYSGTGVTATASGTGRVGTDEAARAFLEVWCEELARNASAAVAAGRDPRGLDRAT